MASHNKKKSGSTRDSLLRAACEVFADKGFRYATVAEICERAGANIAAVNYHFGDKETLYRQAWQMSFQESMEKYPPDGGVGADAPLEEQFYAHVLAMLQRGVDPDSFEFEIMLKEFANPTGLLFEVVHQAIEPLRQRFLALIRGLLGPQATDQQVEMCLMSVRSQCFDVRHLARHRRLTPWPEQIPPSLVDAVGLEAIADHIVRFSLAGIRDIRDRIQTENR
ncbi:MAG: CerR family C-terminal domain-containing protein [Sedimentisphaerales bacterium]|nr:CerR family C-terminal domain-containing protein [Sedimentisphaerales bacterium]